MDDSYRRSTEVSSRSIDERNVDGVPPSFFCLFFFNSKALHSVKGNKSNMH